MGANERPPYPHFGSPTSQGMSPKAKRPWVALLPLALLSRRQYLSRMDRFQHGRSARTLGREGLEINKKCRVFALVCRTATAQSFLTDTDDSRMFRMIYEVLKIPARSTLLCAKSLESAMSSTSATLAARIWTEREFDYLSVCLWMAFAGSTVDIFFRPVNHSKIAQNLWVPACWR